MEYEPGTLKQWREITGFMSQECRIEQGDEGQRDNKGAENQNLVSEFQNQEDEYNGPG
jgi:hypothetical protein